MLKKRQNEVKRKIFLFDEVKKKKNRSAIIAGWEDEAAIKQKLSVINTAGRLPNITAKQTSVPSK